MRAGRAAALGAAALACGLALWLARDTGVQGPAAVPEILRGLAASVVLYGLGGYALARRLTPPSLRPWWPLLALPIGAASTGLVMTAFGFAAIPFTANLAATLVLSGLGAIAFHPKAGAVPGPEPVGPVRLAWPAFLAALLVAIALLPVLRTGYATVVGGGSDAHLATGTATFLQHAYPTETRSELPVDEVPLVWRSKYPIYYSLAGVAALSGLDPVETIATLAALLAGIAALGFFFVARYLLRAGPTASLVAMALVGLNGIVLFTVNHPYFNQTWGLVAMPYIALLSWLALTEPRRGTIALAILFAAIGGFAYPLMLAFPALFLAGCAFFMARDRRREGRPIDWRAPVRRLPRGWRWAPAYALAALALSVPLRGVFEKIGSGFLVVVQGRSLAAWGGDLFFYPAIQRFLSLTDVGAATPFLIALVVALALVGLKGAPRPAALAMLVTFLAAGFFITYFRNATAGQYFYFKALAYLGPLLIVAAATGLALLARSGPRLTALAVVAGAGYLAMGVLGGRAEINRTYPQVYDTQRELTGWARRLPPGATIRLDMRPGAQLWAAYFLHERRLSSQRPILHTSYPHVPVGRKADYIVTQVGRPRPVDAGGRPILRNQEFELFRMRRSVPGPDRSSQRMVQPIRSIGIA